MSGSINPDFITSTPVSKQGMKQQLTNIKNAVAARENRDNELTSAVNSHRGAANRNAASWTGFGLNINSNSVGYGAYLGVNFLAGTQMLTFGFTMRATNVNQSTTGLVSVAYRILNPVGVVQILEQYASFDITASRSATFSFTDVLDNAFLAAGGSIQVMLTRTDGVDIGLNYVRGFAAAYLRQTA
jgi:hypothetical protein